MQRFSGTIWRQTGPGPGPDKLMSGAAETWRSSPLKKASASTITLLFFLTLVIAAFLYSSWIGSSSTYAAAAGKKGTVILTKESSKKAPKRIEFPLNCSSGNQTQTCPNNYYPTKFETIDNGPSSNSTCPDYFRWIHEDLKPFKATGITRDMVERAKRTAHFRLVIIKGKVYLEKYKKSIQTRDVFTIWGILQLLRRYPGRLPDLELMFDCDDRPVVRRRDHRGPNATPPPPVFRYCGDKWTMDVVFPDWSFWGWAEINIKPWNSILKELEEGNRRIKWMDREPYAYWKGNPFVAQTRKDLLKCNVSENQDWNARLFVQDWIRESHQGFNQSDLASQCTYRYKIYIEGWAWSVSEKYILACDAVTLLVKPNFHDFFTRSLQPVQHYWPIRDEDKCRSLKFAVDWGNKHLKKAQEIGKASSDFVQDKLKMEYIYDYMFHLLNGYASLLKFEPRVPEGAAEICPEAMICGAEGLEKKFMMESLVKGPSLTGPCSLPPPFEPPVLKSMLERKDNSIKQVETWEKNYWESLNPKQQ